MAPVLSPIIAAPGQSSDCPLSASSANSSRLRADAIGRTSTSACSSTSSLMLPDGPVDPVREEGLRHVKLRLEARTYKKLEFAAQLLAVVNGLQIHGWFEKIISPEDIDVQKISGALTNAVFFVHHKTAAALTLLLRIYGPSSGSLISRPQELHTLHKLSSVYHIGPLVFGTFENGRIEQFFKSTTLTSECIRDPAISRWIGARMAELHSVDISVVYGPSDDASNGWKASVLKNVVSWTAAARNVLALPGMDQQLREQLDLPRFENEWETFTKWIAGVQDKKSGSQIVFAHNDTQYGNLLRLTDSGAVADEHRQLIVVDFEYAGPNPAAWDIANHFIEWCADYHGATPHLLNSTRYPTFAQRSNFYAGYIHHSNMLGEDTIFDQSEMDQLTASLDYQVRIWSAASHAMWAIWGIVQGQDDIENGVANPDFDYIGYAIGRMTSFREAIVQLGVVQP